MERLCRKSGLNVIHGGANALRFTPWYHLSDTEVRHHSPCGCVAECCDGNQCHVAVPSGGHDDGDLERCVRAVPHAEQRAMMPRTVYSLVLSVTHCVVVVAFVVRAHWESWSTCKRQTPCTACCEIQQSHLSTTHTAYTLLLRVHYSAPADVSLSPCAASTGAGDATHAQSSSPFRHDRLGSVAPAPGSSTRRRSDGWTSPFTCTGVPMPDRDEKLPNGALGSATNSPSTLANA